MKTTGNTILITGGSAGMGLEMARKFAKGNTVIITGRDKTKLEKAATELGSNVTAIPFDVTSAEDLEKLAIRIGQDFPNLNVLINNAGRAFAYTLNEGKGIFDKAYEEMDTNYLSIIRITEKLLPLLLKQEQAAILNVSSVVAFVPAVQIPTYSASKAALHSYTLLLRHSLAGTNVKVFELMPPLVNTDLSKEIGGEKGIAPEVVAADVLDALATDRLEIRTGQTEDLYRLSLASPQDAFIAMNGN